MREIKFRAWDKLGLSGGMIYDVQFRREEQTFDQYINTDEGRYILMQYTGLKDKNGKEIYEGDILQRTKPEWLFVVKWVDFRARFILDGIGTVLRQDISFSEVCEIIGNIHQHPELLDTKEE